MVKVLVKFYLKSGNVIEEVVGRDNYSEFKDKLYAQVSSESKFLKTGRSLIIIESIEAITVDMLDMW